MAGMFQLLVDWKGGYVALWRGLWGNMDWRVSCGRRGFHTYFTVKFVVHADTYIKTWVGKIDTFGRLRGLEELHYSGENPRDGMEKCV